jgi:hypothetical protein
MITTATTDATDGSGRASKTDSRKAAKTVGRATAKGGGIRRESHRVKLIPTNHWDLYGTGANASHR